jgi:hypothetical protein
MCMMVKKLHYNYSHLEYNTGHCVDHYECFEGQITLKEKQKGVSN